MYLKDIKGFEEAMSIEGMVMANAMKKPGDMAVPLRSSNDRIGFVMADGKDAEDAINKCDRALNSIEVTVE